MIKVTINGASGKMGTKVSNLIKNDSFLVECFDDISYSDLVILLILIDYIYEVNIFLNYLPWLWLSLFLMSYLTS